MTALKPTESRRAVGVPSERHPVNKTCSHPECGEPTADPHHIFPRSMIGNDSYFVALDCPPGGPYTAGPVIPHVTGLCRAHHDDVEQHDAWIKLEDGVFAWWSENPAWSVEDVARWTLTGPLDPQPCSGEKRKKPVKHLKGEARRQRRTISIKVPDDTEDGGALWDEMVEYIKARLIREGLYSETDKIPIYEGIMAALNDWRNDQRVHSPAQSGGNA